MFVTKKKFLETQRAHAEEIRQWDSRCAEQEAQDADQIVRLTGALADTKTQLNAALTALELCLSQTDGLGNPLIGSINPTEGA